MASTSNESVNAALPAAHMVFEAINSRDLSRIPELVTYDPPHHGSPFPLPPGPSGYTQILTFVTQVLSIHYEIEDVFCTPERVVVRALATGTSVPAVHGAAFAGRSYTMPRRFTCSAPKAAGSPSTGVSATNWACCGRRRRRAASPTVLIITSTTPRDVCWLIESRV